MSDPTSIPLLRRGAILRYRRLLGLPGVEYGIVAVLGRRKPITVAALPELLGMEQSVAQSSTFGRILEELTRRAGEMLRAEQSQVNDMPASGNSRHR
jgi:hypothetical protein